MFIKNYGLFWQADEIDWFPRKGEGGRFNMLGRQGMNRPGLRLADFKDNPGIYVLYDNHGAYYTGLTTEQGIGIRLRDHQQNDHAGNWVRFSWFGFRQVLKGVDDHGLCRLRELAKLNAGDPKTFIRDVEALLIKAMGLRNISQTQFSEAEEWVQVKSHEKADFIKRVLG